jgi:hypothetical protein
MSIHVIDRPFEGLAALRADYAAVRRRLFGATKAGIIQPVKAPEEISLARAVRPIKLHVHDAHVKAYRRWQMISTNGPCSAHLAMRCAEEGVCFEVISGPSRKRSIVHFRQKLMWEIKTMVKPSMSWPEMGRLFGGRDHTTVLHGVKAHAARLNGEEA